MQGTRKTVVTTLTRSCLSVICACKFYFYISSSRPRASTYETWSWKYIPIHQ